MRKNGGREWRPKGSPEPVRVHDAEGPGAGPRDSLWHLSAWRPREGWMQVGIDHDTAQFAVNSIRGGWEHLGRERSPDARTACGHRSLQWRRRLSDAPVEGRGAAPGRRDRDRQPGRSLPAGHRAAWSTIEHRLFSFSTSNWRGKLPTEKALIVNLIASTRHPQRSLGLCSTRRG